MSVIPHYMDCVQISWIYIYVFGLSYNNIKGSRTLRNGLDCTQTTGIMSVNAGDVISYVSPSIPTESNTVLRLPVRHLRKHTTRSRQHGRSKCVHGVRTEMSQYSYVDVRWNVTSQRTFQEDNIIMKIMRLSFALKLFCEIVSIWWFL